MLTDKEKKWLANRAPVCCELIPPKSFNGKSQSRCPDCKYNLPRQCSIYRSDYRDATEFEARVQRALMYQYEKAYHCKDVSGSFMPDRDTMLMYARIAVEEEMDNERNHA